ncbi:peptidoglycan-binding protein [Kribbella solani]|uniref:peptidoglycan-binding protein n=1 Tax=Kribbella solani TaxID=236067 RepID=UPI0029A2D307|nr:peptidoglycan-binding protein [Kribbella solani]MDX3005570.1 peptidoglycan-binding protein [Kribbella solani]
MTAAVVVAVGAAGVAAAGLDFGAGGDEPKAAATVPPTTGKITRGTMVDTQTETGELGYGDATTLAGRLSGTLTALPSVGTTLSRGDVLGRVDNAPIILLYGTLPAYRALTTGLRGVDVEQFERNLYALGYRGFTVDNKYTASTAKVVKVWQRDLGLPRTGVVDLGRVVYVVSPIRVAEQKAQLGDAVQPGAALFTYTGTSRIALVTLEGADKRLARVGTAVRVTLPDGKQVDGKIVSVQAAAAEAEEKAAKTVVAISIGSQKTVAKVADDASVDVRFTVSERKNVLSVPVLALLAVSEGGYGVQVVADGTSKVVAVRTGMFADGRVEIAGAGLAAGMQVGMPS